MLTLHESTDTFRSFLKFSAIFFAALILLFFLFKIGTQIKEYFFPTPPPKPTVLFGQLPALSFPVTEFKKPIYSIDTLSGTLPAFPTQAKVFKTIEPTINLLSTKRAHERVSTIGFQSKGNPITPTLFEWKKQIPFDTTLVLNIITYNFTLNSNYATDSAVLQGKGIPDEEGAKETVYGFLDTLSLMYEDIDREKTKTTLLSYINGSLITATSFSQTQFIKVDLFQKDIDKIAVYYPNMPSSAMTFLVAGSKEGKPQVVEANFFHQTIEPQATTYPIKSIEQAFQELQMGKGYIAQYNQIDQKIAVKTVSLGYFMNDKKQDYVMPIFVFEGSNNFKAYVSSISEEWILDK